MLAYEDWASEVKILEAELTEIKSKIEYRILNLVGGRLEEPFKRRLTEQEEVMIDHDEVMIVLRYRERALNAKLSFLKTVGQLPPNEKDEIVVDGPKIGV